MSISRLQRTSVSLLYSPHAITNDYLYLPIILFFIIMRKAIFLSAISPKAVVIMKKYAAASLFICVLISAAAAIAAQSTHSIFYAAKVKETGREVLLMDGNADRTYVKKDGVGVIYLAGGCFWGLEKLMESLPGVINAVSGYANGKTDIIPTYELVCTGRTGYRECVRVEYAKDKISLETILFSFFNAIDPSATDRQGNDIGSQYQSGVYYTDDASRKSVARVVKVEKERSYGFAVETEPLTVFHEAEEYHQNYLTKHPGGYCHISGHEMDDAAKTEVDAEPYKVMTESEMAAKLTPLQIKVTQHSATEPPFQNEFWEHDAEGIYVDITTGEPLFSSRDKYKTSCGWPGFTKPLEPNVVRYIDDDSFGMSRTEVRSRAGNAHLGHVFKGDPESPNGVRFCINSASLRFIPYGEMDSEGYGRYKKFVK